MYIELTFAEDRRVVQTRSIKSTMNRLKSAQTAAVDNLIDSMMLMEVKCVINEFLSFRNKSLNKIAKQYTGKNELLLLDHVFLIREIIIARTNN